MTTIGVIQVTLMGELKISVMYQHVVDVWT
jgi:hypothetical protein